MTVSVPTSGSTQAVVVVLLLPTNGFPPSGSFGNNTLCVVILVLLSAGLPKTFRNSPLEVVSASERVT